MARTRAAARGTLATAELREEGGGGSRSLSHGGSRESGGAPVAVVAGSEGNDGGA